MISVIRETFEERYNRYLKDPFAKKYLEERIKFMPIEEIAYLLAEHEKFFRINCKEYESDDDSEKQNEPDPLGRKVDTWGRLMSNGEQTIKNYFY